MLVDLCKEYLHIKYQNELEEYKEYCTDCVPSLLLILKPEPEIVLKAFVE
ncbi:3456_t:CDS:1, partial [Gigaspora margarita]